jgi:hypothetical protein
MLLTYPIRRLGGTFIPQESDNPIVLPGSLQSTIEFPGALSGQQPPSAVSQESTILSSQQVVLTPNTGNQSQVITTLKAGIWRLDIFGTVISDFTPTVPNQGSAVNLVSPVPTSSSLLFLNAVNGVPSYVVRSVLVSLLQDNYLIRLDTIATGAAQNLFFGISLLATRLA